MTLHPAEAFWKDDRVKEKWLDCLTGCVSEVGISMLTVVNPRFSLAVLEEHGLSGSMAQASSLSGGGGGYSWQWEVDSLRAGGFAAHSSAC